MKREVTYREEIARLRARLPEAKTARTANAINRNIRELAAILTGRLPGAWHEITLEDACRITGEEKAQRTSGSAIGAMISKRRRR